MIRVRILLFLAVLVISARGGRCAFHRQQLHVRRHGARAGGTWRRACDGPDDRAGEGGRFHRGFAHLAGKTFAGHLAQSATANALAAKTWSWLVLQDYSLEPTRIGDVPGFLRDGATLSTRLAQHSPHAGIVLYETWARPRGHFYQTTMGSRFAGPAQMMADLHNAYAQLAQKLAALDPSRPVRVAEVGTAFARCRVEFPPFRSTRPIIIMPPRKVIISPRCCCSRRSINKRRTTYRSVLGGSLRWRVSIPESEALDLQLVADEVAGPQSPVPNRRARHITPGPEGIVEKPSSGR